jgi:hypothetical protein
MNLPLRQHFTNVQLFCYKVVFEVLTAVSTKMAVFWVVAPWSLVEVYQLPDYTALQPRRQPSSYSVIVFAYSISSFYEHSITNLGINNLKINITISVSVTHFSYDENM